MAYMVPNGNRVPGWWVGLRRLPRRAEYISAPLNPFRTALPRAGDNLRQITWNLNGLPPKRGLRFLRGKISGMGPLLGQSTKNRGQGARWRTKNKCKNEQPSTYCCACHFTAGAVYININRMFAKKLVETNSVGSLVVCFLPGIRGIYV